MASCAPLISLAGVLRPASLLKQPRPFIYAVTTAPPLAQVVVAQRRRTSRRSAVALADAKTDVIGPPDQVSGVRPVRYYVPADESDEERAWREWRERVDRGHEQFWHDNNAQFEEAKSAFMKQLTGDTGGPPTEDDMDHFYRQFLLERAEQHRAYQRWWLRENFSMLLPALRGYLRGTNRRTSAD
ncbi:hypothetical protein THASP1DRAFT_24210 [Thamnocephalis sphaerospora]|uniref:Apoptogenic protein 1, mitochondrial n=1 Tax=Thamnocephalis sphaerospora TaxID=78915 RepID=A0A4P9XQV7_9FUNG|nr:hypothetical protein THASP1DRAFT_24210 [Thamnocephalis sphaerospora]|eukprot:RKP07690.1 hypothetical protein THASP1DRAFT_24210 [Thamnocephalis sphaerospora]